jgi:hypothetical protein
MVLAIIYLVMTRRGPATSVDKAMQEADAVTQTATPWPKTVLPPATAAPATASSGGLRAPIDRTRAVLNQVKGRNGNGEF